MSSDEGFHSLSSIIEESFELDPEDWIFAKYK